MVPMSRLFEPITLGGVTLANRIAVSPMCQYSAENGSANDWHLQHLGSLSLSGAGGQLGEKLVVGDAGRSGEFGFGEDPCANFFREQCRRFDSFEIFGDVEIRLVER